MEPRHTISVWVDNLPGVLSRVTGLFSGRGFNIESLCVAETMDPEVSRITIVSTGDEQITEQIIKQLHKLINVIKVVDLSAQEHVEREMVLVTVKAEGQVPGRGAAHCRHLPLPGGGRQPQHLYPGDHRQPRQDRGGAGYPQDARHPGQSCAPGPWPSSGAKEGVEVSGQRSAVSRQL